MAKNGASLIVVLVLIALGFAVQSGLLWSDKQSERIGAATPATKVATSAEISANNARDSDLPSRTPSGNNGDSGQSSATLPADSFSAHRELSASRPTMREDRDEQLQTSLPIEPEPLDLNSVVGRPFPVSPTVEKMCRHFKLTCDETLEGLLSQFAQEPRDPPWSGRPSSPRRPKRKGPPAHPA